MQTCRKRWIDKVTRFIMDFWHFCSHCIP
jgi:hypothetical protein